MEQTMEQTMLSKYIVKGKDIRYCKGVSSACLADGCYRISNCVCDTNCTSDCSDGGC